MPRAQRGRAAARRATAVSFACLRPALRLAACVRRVRALATAMRTTCTPLGILTSVHSAAGRRGQRLPQLLPERRQPNMHSSSRPALLAAVATSAGAAGRQRTLLSLRVTSSGLSTRRVAALMRTLMSRTHISCSLAAAARRLAARSRSTAAVQLHRRHGCTLASPRQGRPVQPWRWLQAVVLGRPVHLLQRPRRPRQHASCSRTHRSCHFRLRHRRPCRVRL